MKQKNPAAWVYQLSMLAQSALWIVLSIITILISEAFFPQTLVGILMIANAAVFAVFAFLYKKTSIVTRILVIGFLLANLILTFTDQMGTPDYVVLVLNIICIASYITLIYKSKSEKP